MFLHALTSMFGEFLEKCFSSDPDLKTFCRRMMLNMLNLLQHESTCFNILSPALTTSRLKNATIQFSENLRRILKECLEQHFSSDPNFQNVCRRIMLNMLNVVYHDLHPLPCFNVLSEQFSKTSCCST